MESLPCPIPAADSKGPKDHDLKGHLPRIRPEIFRFPQGPIRIPTMSASPGNFLMAAIAKDGNRIARRMPVTTRPVSPRCSILGNGRYAKRFGPTGLCSSPRVSPCPRMKEAIFSFGHPDFSAATRAACRNMPATHRPHRIGVERRKPLASSLRMLNAATGRLTRSRSRQ